MRKLITDEQELEVLKVASNVIDDKQVQKPKRCALAICAAISGSLGVAIAFSGIFCFGAPLAIIGCVLGIAALVRIRNKSGVLTGRWLAAMGVVSFGVYIIMLLSSFMIFYFSIHCPTGMGDYDKVRTILMEKPELVNAKDRQGYTPLYWASEFGHKNIVELLIAEGADVNAVNGGRFVEQTALHIAVSYGHHDIVQILLANGADVNAKSYNGRTALDMVIRKGHVKIVELLREHGETK